MGLIRKILAGRASKGELTANRVASEPTTLEDASRLAAAGRLHEALRMIDGVLLQRPNDPQWLFARGSLLFDWGRVWEARSSLVSAEQGGLRDRALFLQLGWIELWAGRLSDAERCMRSAAALDSENWQTLFGLGSVLRAQGEYEGAEACYRTALERSPRSVDCYLSLVSCAAGARRFDDAETYVRQAIAAHPNDAAIWASLGGILAWQDRFREASEAFDRAEDITSTSTVAGDPHLDTGIPLRDTGRVEEAISFYRRVLPRNPDLNAHAHYAYSLLKGGNLPEGWDQNEFRWMIEPLRSVGPRFAKPVWAGQDIDGKTVLIQAEQGVGDVLQFIRYARFVKALGATVLILLRKKMREVVDGMVGVDAVYQLGETLPDFDFRIPVMSLPRVFGTTLDAIPSPIPYIPLRPDRVARWRASIPTDGVLNVGVVWSGDPIGLRNPYKSVPLALLAPLRTVPGIRFYSLQKGEAARETTDAAVDFEVIDLSAKIDDFADTAAIIDALDLVISICTSVAHLAGALGKPVWTLLSQPADWRWLESRDDTPWYPTMRLFRQKRQGDWCGVVDDVKRALEDVISDRDKAVTRPTDSVCPAMLRPIIPDTFAASGICKAVATRHGMLQVRPDGTRPVRSVQWYGEYLSSHLDFLSDWIEPGAVVVDVQSGFGAHASFLASTVGETGHLFLLESRPDILPVLANNLRANGVSNVTTISTPLRGMASHAPQPAADDTVGIPLSLTLDALCLPAFRCLKINEEAAPVEVLKGAAHCLWKYRPSIFVSIGDNTDVSDVEACIADFGYRCVRVECPLFDLNNFNRRSEDIFSGQSAQGVFAVPEEDGVYLAARDRKRLDAVR